MSEEVKFFLIVFIAILVSINFFYLFIVVGNEENKKKVRKYGKRKKNKQIRK